MQKARNQALTLRSIALLLLVGIRFQVLFHSPYRGSFHLSLTVLVHYRSQHIFSLTPWSAQIPTGFLVSRGTWDTPRAHWDFAYGAITHYGRPFQAFPLFLWVPHWGPATPSKIASRRFRLFPFRSPLLRESQLISLPEGTEMFHFPSFASRTYVFSTG